jgi:uncharacterized protein YprB with RNaseH-like and TPR domain
MFSVERDSKLTLNSKILNKYNMESIAYFDIETTGFDKHDDIIMLISLGWFKEDGDFHIKQYYAEKKIDEKPLLEAFKKDIEGYNIWCSYNGKAFDEPFIKNRMAKNNIYGFVPPEEHLDLYRLIRPYYKQLGLNRCNLKSVEKYIGINRLDKIDGGKSVELYEKYLCTRSEKIREIIMLHNYEDVLNLPKIFKVVFQIDTGCDFAREDGITEKQLGYLKYLLNKNKIGIEINYNKISKKAASRIIDSLIKGVYDEKKILEIVENSY